KPNLVTGDGTEAFYTYDKLDSTLLATPGVTPSPDDADAGVPDGGVSNDVAHAGDCEIDERVLQGRLVGVSDRAAQVGTAFAWAGRATCVARRIAKPGAPSDVRAQRYAPRWYSRALQYDSADRAVWSSTGAKVVVDSATQQSFVTTAYSLRGNVASVGS